MEETIEKKVREALDSQVVIIPGFFDMDKYKQQLTDEICTLIESFKLSGFNDEQALKLTEVYCRQIVNCVLLDLTRMKNDVQLGDKNVNDCEIYQEEDEEV